MKNKLFYQDKLLIGVDISTTAIKVVALAQHKMQVLAYGIIELDTAKTQKSFETGDDYLGQRLQQLLANNITGQLHSDHAALSIPTGRTYSRVVELPLETESGLDEALRLEVEHYIPLAPEQLYTDYQIIDRGKKTLTVLFSAAPRRFIDSIVAACRVAGLHPAIIEPSASAAARFIGKVATDTLPTIIIDIGAATTDIALFDHVVRVTGTAPVGGDTIALKVAEHLHIPIFEAHQLMTQDGFLAGPHHEKETLSAILEPLLGIIAAEANKIIRYYLERLNADQKISRVVLVGGGANLPGVEDFLAQQLQVAVEPQPIWAALNFDHVTKPANELKRRFITAAGLSSIEPKAVWND